MVLQIAFVLLIASMAVRLYQLQIIQHDFYARQVLPRGKSAPSLAAGPRRGGIYDQKGRELAVSIKLDSVYGIPSRLQQDDNAKIHRMCNILQVPASCLESKLDARQHFIWIKRKVTPQVVTLLEELNLEGIGFREENQRYYPAKELSAQVLGFTGLDNHGLEGVELFFDELLSNTEPYSTANSMPLQRAGAGVASNPKAGKQSPETARPCDTGNQYIQAAGSRFHRALQYREPHTMATSGFHYKACNIFLTLDKVIQYQAEKELNASCTASRARAGTAIVMDVASGEILAMANWPPFNPNSFSKYSPDVRRNRCITDAFEPGSVFKIFLAAAALEAGKLSRNNVIYCENGSFQIGRRTIRDTHQHGWLTFGDIIRVSSNIGAAKIGLSLGREKFSQTIKDFGFGSKTGIRLPGEGTGFIPPLNRWTELTTANISFGQGILTTPLQLITAITCLANKGLWREPRILKSVMQGEEPEAGTEAAAPYSRALQPSLTAQRTAYHGNEWFPFREQNAIATESYSAANGMPLQRASPNQMPLQPSLTALRTRCHCNRVLQPCERDAITTSQPAAALKTMRAGTYARQLCASAPLPLCALTEVSDPGPLRRVVSSETCETLTGMLEMVVNSGTGTAASIPGYRVVGKTGTAQKVDPVTRRYSQDLFCSSFVGFFPACSPRIAILVTIDEPKEEHLAGVVAAPVFRKIAKSIIRYRNIPPVQDGRGGIMGTPYLIIIPIKYGVPIIPAGGETQSSSLLRLAETGSVEEKSTGCSVKKSAGCEVRGAENVEAASSRLKLRDSVHGSRSMVHGSTEETINGKPGTTNRKEVGPASCRLKAEQNALRATHDAPFNKGSGR